MAESLTSSCTQKPSCGMCSLPACVEIKRSGIEVRVLGNTGGPGRGNRYGRGDLFRLQMGSASCASKTTMATSVNARLRITRRCANTGTENGHGFWEEARAA